jgi:hypothetical protein
MRQAIGPVRRQVDVKHVVVPVRAYTLDRQSHARQFIRQKLRREIKVDNIL